MAHALRPLHGRAIAYSIGLSLIEQQAAPSANVCASETACLLLLSVSRMDARHSSGHVLVRSLGTVWMHPSLRRRQATGPKPQTSQQHVLCTLC